MSVTDIVNVARDFGKSSKLKFYKNVIEHHERAKLNWKLMYLGTNNLSADQISRVKFQLQQDLHPAKKLDFMRLLQKNQIVNFNVNSYFMSLNLITSNFK